MRKELISEVLKNGMKDTKNYRYVSHVESTFDRQYRVIKRIAINMLDTTAVLNDKSDTNPNGWETVYEEK